MIDLKVKTQGNPERVVKIGPADLIKFERQYGVGITQFSAESLRYEWLAFLAYTALRREGEAKVDFDAWVDTLDELAPESEGNEGSDGEAASSTSSQP